MVIFFETGVIITPFLPGDSLLFVAGSLAARDTLNPWVLYVLLLVASILGNTVNYSIGRHFGNWILKERKIQLVRPSYIQSTHAYFEKYGGLTLIITRFLPIVRTIAPFLAGMGEMSYRRYTFCNIFGAWLWITSL